MPLRRQERTPLSMKRIYITAIPLDSNFAITPYAAEPVNYTQTTTQPTCYPITPILADTASCETPSISTEPE